MSRKLVSAFKVLFILYLSIGLLIWFTSPWVVNYFVKPVLAEQKLGLTESSSIRYNPFLTKVSIHDFGLYKLSESEENTAFEIEDAVVEVSFWRLISDKVYISELVIDGMRLKANIADELIEISGVAIPKTEEQVEEETNTPDKEELAQAQSVPTYQLVLNHIEVKNSAIDIIYQGNPHQVAIDEILIQDTLLSEKAQSVALSVNLSIDNQPIKLASQANLENREGDAELSFSIEKLGLSQFSNIVFSSSDDQSEPQGNIESGELSFQLEQRFKLTSKEITTNFESLALTLENVSVTTQGVTAKLTEQHIEAADLGVEIDLLSTQSPLAALQGDLAFTLSDFHLHTESEAQTLAKVKSLAANEIGVTLIDGQPTINVPKLAIENADFSDDLEDELPSLARFTQMDILDTQVSAAGLSIEQVNIAGFGVDVKRASDGRILGLVLPSSEEGEDEQLSDAQQTQAENQEQLEQQADIAEAIEERTEMDAEDKFPMAINQIALVDLSHINVIDEKVEPIYRRFFDVETLTIGPLDNQQVDLMTHLKLKGSSNNFSYFDFDADMKLYADKPYYKLAGLFKEVDLPELSTYLKDVLQYEFDNGQLDVEMDVEIDNTAITGNTNVFLRNVELAAANNPEGSTIEDSGAIPFNIALGMLKDGDGNVNLDIPLKGSTDSPDFSLQGFVVILMKKATMLAAKEYLITTFVPYANVVKVGLSASDYLLKVSFNDLPYNVADTNYNQEAEPFINQFSAFMQDKEDVNIKVCALSVPR